MALLKYNKNSRKKANMGYGVLEVIIGLSIVAVGLFTVLQTYSYYLRFAMTHKYDVGATLLAEEGIEVVRLLRDSGWDSNILPIESGRRYHLIFTGSLWTATTSVYYVDNIFDRVFTLEDVYRDSNDDISTTGYLDSGTKKLTVDVSYKSGLSTTTKSLITYLSDNFSN